MSSTSLPVRVAAAILALVAVAALGLAAEWRLRSAVAAVTAAAEAAATARGAGEAAAAATGRDGTLLASASAAGGAGGSGGVDGAAAGEPPPIGCAALRRSLLFYNRAPKTGSTSLRDGLRALASRCGLAVGACHKHSGPNTDAIVALSASSLRCGSVFACHIRDTPAVRGVVDRAARRCPGGGLRFTSVRRFAEREASQILEWTGLNASAATAGLPEAAIRARLDTRGDYLATYFGLREPDAAAEMQRGANASGPASATPPFPPVTEAAVATALSWYDAVVDVTLGGGAPAAAILSALLGEPVEVPHHNVRARGGGDGADDGGGGAAAAWAARVAAVRAASLPGGGLPPAPRGTPAVAGKTRPPYPDEVLYAVGARIHRHLAHFLLGADKAPFDDETGEFKGAS